jgi:tetratricopeptide (TPR) repeat protein
MAPFPSALEHVALLKESFYASGYAALSAGRLPDAQRCFGLQLAVSPTDYRAWTGLAACRERALDYAMAANCYALGDRFEPTLPWCKIGEARTRLQLNQRQEVEQLLDRAEAQTSDLAALSAISQLRHFL